MMRSMHTYYSTDTYIADKRQAARQREVAHTDTHDTDRQTREQTCSASEHLVQIRHRQGALIRRRPEAKGNESFARSALHPPFLPTCQICTSSLYSHLLGGLRSGLVICLPGAGAPDLPSTVGQ